MVVVAVDQTLQLEPLHRPLSPSQGRCTVFAGQLFASRVVVDDVEVIDSVRGKGASLFKVVCSYGEGFWLRDWLEQGGVEYLRHCLQFTNYDFVGCCCLVCFIYF